MQGLRERLDSPETGYGTLLLPGIRAEILVFSTGWIWSVAN